MWSGKRINHKDLGLKNGRVSWNKKGSVRTVLDHLPLGQIVEALCGGEEKR